MKVEGTNIIDAFDTAVIFFLIENSLTILHPSKQYYIPLVEEILNQCGIEIDNIEYHMENTNNSIKLDMGQIFAIQSLLDNHDAYKNIAILVEL